MKKYEVTVEDANSEELISLLKKLPYVKGIHESENNINIYSLASERSLSEDWLFEDDDELQKLYGK